MSSERELVLELQRRAQEFSNLAAAANHRHVQALAEVSAKYDNGLSQIAAAYADSLKQVHNDYESEVTRIRADLGKLPFLEGDQLGWDREHWTSYVPEFEMSVPELTRVGRLILNGTYDRLEMPALVPIIGTQNLLIKAEDAGKVRARQLLQSVALRLLLMIPPGKLRLICIDPVGLGATMAGFIKGLPDTLTGGQAWFETTHIEGRLADLEAHMATVKQKYLGVRYQSIEQYNQDAGEVAEPYRVLVVADFPSRFSDIAAQRLVSIATNGPATGVYVLAMADVAQKMPYNFDLSDIERTSATISSGQKNDVWQDPDFSKCMLVLDEAPPPDLFEQLVENVSAAATEASEVRVPFSRYMPPVEEWWKTDSRSALQAAIGRRGAENVQYLELDEQLASSALAIGRPGSGKSTMLHTLITSLAIQYSPAELELYLLDLKQVEFEDYATYELPHARVVAVQSEREFGLSVLRGLQEELQRRMDLFGGPAVKLSEYRNKTGQPMPRILLIIDEFQELFSEDDSLAGEAAQILDRLIRMGRAFGINTLLASQTLAGPYTLARATKDQIPVRIALQCADADSRLILSDENDLARLLERPGEAIYNANNGQIGGNKQFQVFWITRDEREGYLRAIRDKADREGYIPQHSQIVFRGNESSHIESNSQLMEFLCGEGSPDIQRSDLAWLGEPIEIKSHTAAVFRRQSRSNLLIVGQNQYEASAVSMLLSALTSLVAQHPPETASFALLNLTSADASWHNLPHVFEEAFPHPIRVGRRRDTVPMIEEIVKELRKRLADTDDVRWSPLYLAIFGLQRARDLRLDENARYRLSDEPEAPADMLASICREGPDVGIHTLLWCDTYAGLERVFGHSPEREFDMRVALQMSAEDSRRLLDSDAAGKIGPFRAVYYDEDRTGRSEKFRPYELPAERQLVEWGQRLRRNA